MAIGLRFMTSKVMERVLVLDWKVGWEVSLILEALRECYPLAAFVACTSQAANKRVVNERWWL
jgi:hypothetical protein